MQPIDYRCMEILVGEKRREITIYSEAELEYQRHLLRQNKAAFARKIHRYTYGYVENRSN
ncbi:MAG: hypothetical protein FWF69_04980 [Firmicutes bacterium]|nr:hypothetical protein [Bacillota bacterium]